MKELSKSAIFLLDLSNDSTDTSIMNNTTNYTVKELTEKIAELCELRFPGDLSMKWSYVSGVLEAILDFEVRGYNKGFKTLQEAVNESFIRYDQDLQNEKALAASN
jgi:hypothetical protein